MSMSQNEVAMNLPCTLRTVETAEVDLRLQSLRQRDKAAEKLLLASIRTQGIREPLLVVMPQAGKCVLLDGFKRYRCARQLGIGVAPVQCAEGDERSGLLALLRYSRNAGLSEIEHGALVDWLHTKHGMSVAAIALELGCSTGWVSLRLGMMRRMSPVVRRAVLSGRFPPRSYLYGLRPFTRVNDVQSELVDSFVSAVAGRSLSTRDIFLLTKAYFTGSPALRLRIQQGEAAAVLEAMKSEVMMDSNDRVGAVLEELVHINASMARLCACLPEVALDSHTLAMRAHLVAITAIRSCAAFTGTLRRFYDQTAEALGGDGTVGAGDQQEADRTVVGAECQDGALDNRGQGAAPRAAQQTLCAAPAGSDGATVWPL